PLLSSISIMTGRLSLLLILVVATTAGLLADDRGFEPTLTLIGRPVVLVPTQIGGNSSDKLSTGIGGDLVIEYRPSFLPNLHLGVAGSFDARRVVMVVPALIVPVQRFAWRFDLGISFGNLSGIYGGPYAGIGTSIGGLTAGEQFWRQGTVLCAGVRLSTPLLDRIKLVSQVEFLLENNLVTNDITASVGIAYDLRRTIPGGPIRASEIQTRQLFPAQYRRYGSDPIGSVVIENVHDAAAHDLSVAFFVPEARAEPYICQDGIRLGSGESVMVELFAPIVQDALTMTEGIDTVGTITVTSEVRRTGYEQQFQSLVTILDPNSIDWSDNERVGAFVTPRDEAVLALAREINRSIPLYPSMSIDLSVQRAIAVVEALGYYDFRYAEDPNTPFSDLREDRSILDTVLFPSQTIGLRSGDCDDLTVLFCALLESLGTETAFITMPGHILPAVRVDEGTSNQALLPERQLITSSGARWLPVEITRLHSGYDQVFDAGHTAWEDGSDLGSAELWPMHHAWEKFEPVRLPSDASPRVPLADVGLDRRVALALERFVRSQIQFDEQQLLTQIARTPSDTRLRNRLGVLYARHGLLPDASRIFTELAEAESFLPAMLNLGGVLHLQNRNSEALSWLQRAMEVDPGSPRVRLGLSQVYHELGRYDEAAVQHAALAELNPELAESIAYTASQT
ncbi:MAG: tetratricopeptide repeat protein, partial [Spirochaetaceae bacterium]|nr:tetratricopeptide repeat protein [Spirochaetaceae bacterium]